MKQQILIQLWLAQLNSDSSNVNELEHDGKYTVTANENDNQHECKRDIAVEDVDSSDEVDGNEPQIAKITKSKFFHLSCSRWLCPCQVVQCSCTIAAERRLDIWMSVHSCVLLHVQREGV